MSKPKIRFKGYEEDWEQRKLSKVAKYRNGKAHENSIAENGKYIVVNSKFVSTDGRVRKFSNEQIEPLYKGEIAFVLSDVPNGRAIARTFLVDKDGKYTLNQRIAGITPYENTDSYFLHILMNRNRYFLKFDDGNKQTNLSVNDVTNFEEKYPSYEEQYKIGQCFSNLDHLITLHQRKCEETKKLKKYMLQKMFPQNRKRVPEIRFAGFTDDWEQRKLGDLTTYRNGTGHEEKQSDVGKYELVNLNSISIDGGLKPSGKFIDEETETLIKDDLVMVLSDVGHGDLLGRVAIIPENNRFVLNQRVALLRNNGFADTKYLFSYINAHQRYFKLQGAGSSQLNISRGSVENFEVLLPKRDEQKQIGECFSNLDHLITLHQRKYEELQKIKKFMLQNMFI
ncbi:restriction endonuclease subunit S [Anaerostipes hadrus]|uniref:Restriction endonuclease subunit S n=1 Tax=Anaerostipes hadrus TaxID=649756 RepID=A0AAQ3JHL1_ANAHA|nr:restriction endonuclease subunit S [Anaerostipes hadrus]WMD16102.1 restriction endonuclease subunit S [Anaerostipes hadrus]WMD24966.1 restriction endonuclease subunit S [Anaerostipes hadrus]